MKICMVHNEYGRISGEETVVRNLHQLLADHRHQITAFVRSSASIADMRLGNVRAFCSGIYNPFSRQAFHEQIEADRPDIVHVHNVFPLISPSILGEARRAGIPVVMTVHNYRLICPNGLHMANGKICEKCVGGREYWCVLKRCEGSLAKSTAYGFKTQPT